MSDTITLILVDDHKILRNGIRSLLEGEPDIEVLGEAENGREAIRLVRDAGPDVVIMDVSMPDMNGVEATRRILEESRNVRILALSAYADKQFIVEMLKAGALGYVLKDSAFEELMVAVRTVAAWNMYITPKLTHSVISDFLSFHASGVKTADSAPLTPRERQVLQMIAEGKNSKTIAASLQISIKTADTHRQNIMKKLDLHSIAELTRYAIKLGLIPNF